MRKSDLATLGTLALQLARDDARDALHRAAETLRTACDADVCELFLREPEGGDLVLTGFAGPDLEVFTSRERFPLGNGFPGLAAASGHKVFSMALADDKRFLRHAVTDAGINAYLCVPLADRARSLGTLGLAWRDGPMAAASLEPFLSQAAMILRNGIAARLACAAAEARAAADCCPNHHPGTLRLAFLRTIAGAVGAREASVVVSDPKHLDEPTITSTTVPAPLCDKALLGGEVRCPLLRDGHGIVSCPRRDVARPSLCCLPLRRRDQLAGAVFLDLGGEPPTPRTQHLVALLTMAAAGAPRLLRHPNVSESGRFHRRAELPTLSVLCLGPWELRLRQRALGPEEFTRRKALTLLKVLILRAGSPTHRDQLVEMLWPGVHPAAGINRFHVVLHALRSVIEPFREERRWTYIRNHGELYYFNMEAPHRIDLYRFRHLAATAAVAERRGQVDEAIEILEEGLALYRGDLFADDPYADWCVLEREQMRRTYLDMVRRLAALALHVGHPARGLEHLRRALAMDPLSEELHQRMIEALTVLGRRGEVLAQYRTCAELLRRELGTGPLPATRELVRRALRPARHAPAPDPVAL